MAGVNGSDAAVDHSTAGENGFGERVRPDETSLTCSAKGCRARAEFALLWRNPKLHSPDRRKTWLACPEHRAHLSGFLTARGFLQSVEPLDPNHPA
jgi:hypothetical protein